MISTENETVAIEPKTLADIMASPEALERAADEFYECYASYVSQTKNNDDMKDLINDDMNHGVETADDFARLLEECGQERDLEYYEKFCKIGAENDDDMNHCVEPKTLADIMASPEALERAADEFYECYESYVSQTKNNDDLKDLINDDINYGVETPDDLAKLLEECGQERDPEYYKNFCKICANR